MKPKFQIGDKVRQALDAPGEFYKDDVMTVKSCTSFSVKGEIVHVYTVVFRGNITTAYREEHLVAVQ